MTCSREQGVLDTLRYLFLIEHFFVRTEMIIKKKEKQSKSQFLNMDKSAKRIKKRTIEEKTSHKW